MITPHCQLEGGDAESALVEQPEEIKDRRLKIKDQSSNIN